MIIEWIIMIIMLIMIKIFSVAVQTSVHQILCSDVGAPVFFKDDIFFQERLYLYLSLSLTLSLTLSRPLFLSFTRLLFDSAAGWRLYLYLYLLYLYLSLSLTLTLSLTHLLFDSAAGWRLGCGRGTETVLSCVLQYSHL